ncbi:meiotic nuclear division protein 1 homolog isoform X2 [Erpetoichthys calabaricus]|uniref:meiotic nuclear division protein 1 homolog isoform X2 n=1 Tax=Erpetoichthys calabaricus TaxID=27687 RepID=UPI002234B08B|nr:meiotic nuclear division protein 1 homolog isoform X2 [Erpetoichthys calabaricus]
MSKKKGLSLEEKRSRMMEIFFETKDVFQLKDMEKIAPKMKGITPMSVKDVLQSLVDDGMVDTERVGTSNYYWAFPSKALHARKRKLNDLEKQTTEGEQKKTALELAVKKAKMGRQDTGSLTKQQRKQLTDGQITSLPLSHGPRENLHLKKARSIKPLVYQKILTTLTDTLKHFSFLLKTKILLLLNFCFC